MQDTSQAAQAAPTIPPFSTAEMRSYPLGTLVYRSGLMPLETVNQALEGTLIPSAKNAELKSLLETGLTLFREHQAHAEQVAKAMK